MRELRTSGSEGGAAQTNALFLFLLPLLLLLSLTLFPRHSNSATVEMPRVAELLEPLRRGCL